MVEGVPEQMFDLVTFALREIEDSVTYVQAVPCKKGWDTSKLLLKRGTKLFLVAVVVGLLLVVPLAVQEGVVFDMDRIGDLGAVGQFVEGCFSLRRIEELCDFAFSFQIWDNVHCTGRVAKEHCDLAWFKGRVSKLQQRHA